MPVLMTRPVRGNMPPAPTKPKAVRPPPASANPVKVARRVEMLAMQRRGTMVSDLAKHFGMSLDEMKYQLGIARREAGIPKPKRSCGPLAMAERTKRREQVVQMLQQGVSWDKIRMKVGVTWERVAEIAAELISGVVKPEPAPAKPALEAVAVMPARVSSTMQVLCGKISRCSLPKCNVLFQRTRPDQVLCGKHERHAAAIKERADEDRRFALMRAGKLRL